VALISKETVNAHEDLTTVDVRLEAEVLQLETNRSTGDKISTYHHVDTACIFGTKIRHVNRMWLHTAVPTLSGLPSVDEFLHCLLSQQFVFTSEFRPRRKCISLQANRRNSDPTHLIYAVEYPVGNPAGTPVIPSSYGAASEHPGQNWEISPRRLADAWPDLQNASQPFYHLIRCYTINSVANRHLYFTDSPAKNIFQL